MAIGYEWRLRVLMAEHGMFKAIDLAPKLAEHRIRLSDSQVWRLVTGRPERLNLRLLMVLCEILDCEPRELVRRTDVAAAMDKKESVSGPDDPQRPEAQAGQAQASQQRTVTATGKPVRHRECRVCGRIARIELRARDGRPDMCSGCAPRPLGTCGVCGRERWIARKATASAPAIGVCC